MSGVPHSKAFYFTKILYFLSLYIYGCMLCMLLYNFVNYVLLLDVKYLGYRISEYKSDFEDKLQTYKKINGAIRRHFGKK
jgi:hypothetical protein